MNGRRATTATSRRLYLDTSAYLCILLAEEGWQPLSAETNGAELLSSVLLVLETRRNLVRLAREGAIKPDQYEVCLARVEQDTRVFAFREVTLDLCQSNVLPAVATPRSPDLVHLRSALWLHGRERIDRFVTLDTSQQQSARELGLPV